MNPIGEIPLIKLLNILINMKIVTSRIFLSLGLVQIFL